MTLLVISLVVVLVVSALCSLAEAALYAVRMPFVRRSADSGNTAGKVLVDFKENMEQPISAILIVNTVANTAGAAVAGAQARYVFGEDSVIAFSVAITLAVLFLSEIAPKIIGVAYSERLAMVIALPLQLAIAVLSPIIWIIQKLSGWLKPKEKGIVAPESEVEQLAMMSAEEGSILPIEAKLVSRALEIDDITAGQIMTPHDSVFQLDSDLLMKDVAKYLVGCPHSRIPVVDVDSPGSWIGLVMQRQILSALANDEFLVRLDSLCQPIHLVDESAPGHQLLKQFISRRTHLFGVVNAERKLVGVVSLEDVIESLVGAEIVDETDIESDESSS